MIVRPKRQTGQAGSPRGRHALRHASLACAGVLMSVALNAWSAPPDAAAGASVPVAGATAAAPARYAVQPGQSVTDIAEEITQSHDRATRDRMAAALFKANPGAFMGNDPNRLKIGATLVVPGAVAASAAAVSSAPSAAATAATGASATTATAAATTLAASHAASQVMSQAGSQAASSPAQSEAPQAMASSTAAAAAAPLAASSSEHGRAWSGSIQTSNGSGLSAGSSITGMRGSTEASTGSVFSPPQGASAVHADGVSGPAAAATAATTVPAAATPVRGTVSSLEQLLALKNRVLTALEKHDVGSAGSSSGVAAGHSTPATAGSSQAASGAPATAAGVTPAGALPASTAAAGQIGQPAASNPSWLNSALLLPVLGIVALILLVALLLNWMRRPRGGSEREVPAQPAPAPTPVAPTLDSAPAIAPAPAPVLTPATVPRPASIAAGAALFPGNPTQAETAPLAPDTAAPQTSSGATADPVGQEPAIYPEASRQTSAEARDTEADQAALQSRSDTVSPVQPDHAGALDDSAARHSVPDDEPLPPMPDAVRAAFGAIDLSLPELPPLMNANVQQPSGSAAPSADAALKPHEETPASQQETPPFIAAQHGATAVESVPTLASQPQPEHADLPPAETGPASVAGLGAAGFGALDLNFDLESPPGGAQPATPFSDSDLAAIARNKLDLAIEYVKLGDIAGARTLISEVIESNDAATQIQARTLLASLAALS